MLIFYKIHFTQFIKRKTSGKINIQQISLIKKKIFFFNFIENYVNFLFKKHRSEFKKLNFYIRTFSIFFKDFNIKNFNFCSFKFNDELLKIIEMTKSRIKSQSILINYFRVFLTIIIIEQMAFFFFFLLSMLFLITVSYYFILSTYLK